MLVLHRGYHIVTVDTDRQRVFEAVHEFIAGREEQRRQQEQRGRTGQAFGSGGRQQERSA
jgi:hypothetical protein